MKLSCRNSFYLCQLLHRELDDLIFVRLIALCWFFHQSTSVGT
uniref:ATP-dependent DNA helicase 2 subunit KU70 n=1 Tax=Rhizophora mucronata TaxID=61149 RepID=A0A2P2J4B7_RHIMU